MEEKEKNINLIEEQREELTKWKNTLLNYLLKEIYDQEEIFEIFVISKYWFDRYKKFIFQKNIKDFSTCELFDNYKDKNNELFTPFTEKEIKIRDLSEVFVLNKTIWSYIKNESCEINTIITFGSFANKLLILKVLDLVYCFIFLDKKKIRQGYIKIMRKEDEQPIIDEFKNKGFFDFISNNKNKISDDIIDFKTKKYEIYVFKASEQNKDNDEKNEVDEKEKIYFERKRSQTLSLSILMRGKKTNELNFIFGEKIFKIPKIKKFMEEEIMGGAKKLFTKYLELLEQKQKENKLTKIIKPNPNSIPDNKIIPNENQNQSSDIELIPGIIGLQNIGATCYMNATVQCFSNIERFRGNLLNAYEYLKKNKETKKLSFGLAEVFRNLWINLNNKDYPPYDFKKIIGEMNPLFSGIAANDPKDLILFLLETMHKELNNPPKKNIENNYLANCQNFNSVFNEFIKDFTNNNNSIICQEFYGCSNSMTTCGYCLNTIHNVQALNILFFPLEEVRKFINKNRNSVTIEDCFLYYQKQDIYPSFYCNNCRQLYAAYNQSKLVYAPPTIIINLNRGRGIQYDVKIEFEEYLNIRDFVYSPDSPNYYELIGVICHFGTNDMGGHFIAFCKNSNNLQWYKYNDGEVNISSFSEIKQAHLPYVLFYSFIAT